MSKIRVNELETLDGLNIKDVATLVDDINNVQVTTATGEQTLVEALDARVQSGLVGDEQIETDTGVQDLKAALNSRIITQEADIEVTVGTSGDFATINEALAHLSKRYPSYEQMGREIGIVLLDGFVMEEQVLLTSIDLSWISIFSEASEVTINRESLTQSFNGRFPAFGGNVNAALPRIAAHFWMDNTGDGASRDGFAIWNSMLDISKRGGQEGAMRNAGAKGLWCSNAARFNGDRAIIRESQEDNIYAQEVSFLNCDKMDLRDAARYAIRAQWSAYVSFKGDGATGNEANASGAGDNGLDIRYGSNIGADKATINNCGGDAIHCTLGSSFDFNEGVATGALGNGIVCAHGSVGNVRNADVSGAGIRGIDCNFASTLNANGCNASGAGGPNGIRSLSGSTVNFREGNARKGASNDPGDMSVSHGGVIVATDAIGGTVVSPNTLSGRGIIYVD
jgi:hypothetical protein